MPELFEGNYEGWKNQATWAVALRINNDPALFGRMLNAQDLRFFLNDFCRFGYTNADREELFEHFFNKRKEIFACRLQQKNKKQEPCPSR